MYKRQRHPHYTFHTTTVTKYWQSVSKLKKANTTPKRVRREEKTVSSQVKVSFLDKVLVLWKKMMNNQDNYINGVVLCHLIVDKIYSRVYSGQKKNINEKQFCATTIFRTMTKRQEAQMLQMWKRSCYIQSDCWETEKRGMH